MSDIITGIMIKNMAREMVKRATVKNADMRVKRAFTWKGVQVNVGAPIEKANGTYFVKPSYFEKNSIAQHDATYYGCRVQPDNVEGVTASNTITKNAALREVAVTYEDGTTITTSMAAHLSDADIKNYFRAGREFNIGSGGKDKMVKVKSVKILNATAKNAAYCVEQTKRL